MKKITSLVTLFYVITVVSFGQNINSLKLSDAEIPAGYSRANELLCVTPHAYSFYKQTDLYQSFLGKVIKKEYQSFEKKGDRGSVLYLQSDKEFEGQDFLESLLWGEGLKPSKSEPDDYYSKGDILVIWSFNLKSEIKKVSKSKVTMVLR